MKPAMIHAWGIAGLALLSAVTWGIALRPRLQARANYHVLIEELASKRNLLHDVQDQERISNAKLTELRRALEMRPVVLQSSDTLSKRLQQITELANESGLKITSIETGKSEPFARYDTLAIVVAGRTSLTSLRTFFKKVNDQMPDLSVRSVQVSGRYSDASSVPVLTMELSLHTTASAG